MPFDLPPQATGLALIAAFVLFAIGASLPLAGAKGNPRFYALAGREHLWAVARNATIWRLANVLMGAAAVVLLIGLGLLTASLEAANERVFARLGLIGWLVATALWVAFSAFRAIVTTRAAHDLSSTDAMPAGYEPMARKGSAVFFAYAVVGFLALATYGMSLLQLTIVPAWAAWLTLVSAIALLIHLLVTGDTLPAFHYVPPLLIGLLLLLRP